MEVKVLSEKHILRKFDLSSAKDKISRNANLASTETARSKADMETAYPNFGLLDFEKKKEQFLTIDRF